MVKELIAEGFTEDEIAAIYVDNGFDDLQARSIIARELGRNEEADDRVEAPDA